MGKIGKILESLLPPADADPRHLQIWRVTIAGYIVTFTSVVAFHIAWACGVLPWVSGFASAADLKDQYAQIQSIRELQLEDAIQRSRERNCKAINEGNADARQISRERLLIYMKAYRELTGRNYVLMDCGSI